MREAIARQGIYHPPVAAVTVAYPKDAFKDVELPNGFGALRELPGFGSLNPRTEGVRLGLGLGLWLGLGFGFGFGFGLVRSRPSAGRARRGRPEPLVLRGAPGQV